jgi:hypothetical protein
MDLQKFNFFDYKSFFNLYSKSKNFRQLADQNKNLIISKLKENPEYINFVNNQMKKINYWGGNCIENNEKKKYTIYKIIYFKNWTEFDNWLQLKTNYDYDYRNFSFPKEGELISILNKTKEESYIWIKDAIPKIGNSLWVYILKTEISSDDILEIFHYKHDSEFNYDDNFDQDKYEYVNIKSKKLNCLVYKIINEKNLEAIQWIKKYLYLGPLNSKLLHHIPIRVEELYNKYKKHDFQYFKLYRGLYFKNKNKMKDWFIKNIKFNSSKPLPEIGDKIIFNDSYITSWSYDLNIAKTFADKKYNIIFSANIPDEMIFIDLSKFICKFLGDDKYSQNEVLVKPINNLKAKILFVKFPESKEIKIKK